MTTAVEIRAPAEQTEGTRSQVLRWLKNVGEAHAFINYLQKPEVAAENSNLISYANGNLASQKLIDKEVLDDPTIYPDAETMSRLYTIKVYDAPTQRLMNRLWTRIKTGR